MNLGMNLIFYLVRHTQIYLIKFIHMGVLRLTWAFQKYFSISNMQYVKSELSYEAEFFAYSQTSTEAIN